MSSARAVGATHALDPADGDPVAAVKALTGGRGADYALEAAGPPEAMAQALAMTRPAGTMVPAGWETLSSTVTLPAVDFAVGGKRIQSCQYGGAHIRRDIPRFARMLEAGLLDAEPLVSRRFALEEVNEALAAALSRELITAVIVPDSPSLTYDCPTMSTAPTDAATTTAARAGSDARGADRARDRPAAGAHREPGRRRGAELLLRGRCTRSSSTPASTGPTCRAATEATSSTSGR